MWRRATRGACAAALLLALGSAGGETFRLAVPGYHFLFPRDHFDHPDFQMEWWYYTGNLRDSAGKRFGFELVFFRHAEHRGAETRHSAWRVDDLYLAHLAVTDIDRQRFYNYRRLNRAGPGIAGASFPEQRVWNGNWSARWNGELQRLEATAEDVRFELDLNPVKPPVIHGVGGVSQKAEGAGKASYYVSLPRLEASGDLVVKGQRHAVNGTAWMDHEWFTNQLGENQAGWDWFSVQLDNRTELMLFELRRKDGGIDPYSSGTYIDAQGHARHLSQSDFSLTPSGYWKSARTGANYPVRWEIHVPALGLALYAGAALDAQELAPEDRASTAYWEGAVSYSGSATGVGYLEMTGYDKPVRLE